MTAVSLGFLSHTAIFPVAVRYMADNDYDVNDGIEDGDVYAVSDGLTGGVPHPGDFYSFVPICIDGEVIAWAIGINHLMENGAPVAGSWATFSVDTFMDGLVCPPMRTGRKLKQESWWKAIWERRTRAATMNILDDIVAAKRAELERDKAAITVKDDKTFLAPLLEFQDMEACD